MKPKQFSVFILVITAAVLMLTLAVDQVRAQDIAEQICAGEFPPEADYDQDGIRNFEECQGLVKDGDNVFLNVPGYEPNNPDSLNPAYPDLFVILVKANDRQPGMPSFLPDDPFRYVKNPMADGGLALRVHEIHYEPDGRNLLRDGDKADPSYRAVIMRADGTFQKAMKIEESLSTTNYELAKCLGQWGTPNDGDDCWVYSQRIINHISEICGGYEPATCVDDLSGSTLEDIDPSNGIPDIAEVFMRGTVAHEIGHDVKLRDEYVAKTGGWHYAARDKVMLSQYVDYRAGRKGVTFYIADEYAAPPDADKATIWEEQ